MTVGPEEEVLGLQVPVDDSLFVRGREPPRHLQRDVHHLLDPHRPRVQPVAERLPFEELHDRVGDPLLLPEIEDRQDVRVRERGDDLGLVPEAVERLRVVGEDVGKDLDRDVPVEFRVPRPEDLSHSTRAETSEDLVRAQLHPRGEAHRTGSPLFSVIRTISLGRQRRIRGPHVPVPRQTMTGRPPTSYRPSRRR